jgi:multiple sugar transport system ATP-binding protein
MSLIEIEKVSKKFGAVTAVDRLDLTVQAGEFLTLLGPSGCGKTTVLRMIAGLEIPDEGVIRIKDKTVFSSREGIYVAPGKRGLGLVFQSYALWPHMTVFENVAFGLQVQGAERKELEDRVHTSLDYMRLRGMEKRYPQQLSGGQQQRVALARMLVTRPSIFLMDEPLSNLDAKLRMEMRAEIKRLHWEAKATTLYVTHDQNEALTLSTQVAVMNKGVLQQVASPHQIYRRPANLFVADFIGSPTINFIPGKIHREAGNLVFRNESLLLPAPPEEGLVGKEVTAAIRPEDIRILPREKGEGLGGEVYSVLPAGAEVILQVKKGNLLFTLRVTGEVSFEMGEKVYLLFPPEAMVFYDREKGDLLYPSREQGNGNRPI